MKTISELIAVTSLIEDLTAEQKEETIKLLTTFKNENGAIKVGPESKPYLPTMQIFSVKCKTQEDVFDVLEKLPPVDAPYDIGQGATKISDRKFVLTIDNPCQRNSAADFHLGIRYKYKETDVFIDIPLYGSKYADKLRSLLEPDKRHVSESEYVHFLGMSSNYISNIKVTAFKFRNDWKTRTINWYGGNKSTLDGMQIDELMFAILDTTPTETK